MSVGPARKENLKSLPAAPCCPSLGTLHCCLGWIPCPKSQTESPGLCQRGLTLSLLGAWQGYMGLQRQQVGSVSNTHPVFRPGEAVMALEQMLFISPLTPSHAARSGCGKGGRAGASSALWWHCFHLSLCQPFHHTPLWPEVETNAEPAPCTRSSGGGCTSSWEREQSEWIKHEQVTKSKQQMKSFFQTKKRNPVLQQAAHTQVSACFILMG